MKLPKLPKGSERWVKLGLIGLGTGALFYVLERVLRPASTPLVLYDAGAATGAGEFATTGRRIAATLGTSPIAIRSAADVTTAITRATGRVGPVVLVGHGTTRTFFPGYGITPERLAAALAPKLAPRAVVGLAGCRAAGDPGSADWEAAAFGPGGATSFAGLLRDALVRAGSPWGVEVRGHSTTGHASANPAIRLFRASGYEVGTMGSSGLDLLYGAGAWRNDDLRRRWTQQFRGMPAELWIAGGQLSGQLA